MAAVLILGSSLASCAPEEQAKPERPTAIVASVEADTQPTVEVAPLDAPSRQGITDLGAITGFVAGTPMSVELAGEIPNTGVTLTRTYATPLPEAAAATFAFWNAEVESWQAVPSTLSDDRRTLTAVVHHLSWWNDFIAGGKEVIDEIVEGAKNAGQAVGEWVNDSATDFAEGLRWGVGNIFSTRVELPECDFPTPNWVQEISVRTDVDDPVRFCVGYDKAQPQLLVVNARSNRGYGFPVELAVKPTWQYNSSSENTLGADIEMLGHIDEVVGKAMGQLLNNGRFVAAGQEISYGIPASAMKGYDAEYLIELPAPTGAQFVVSTISQLVLAWGVDNVSGMLGASIAVASCWSDFASSDNASKVAISVLKCLSGADTEIAQMYATMLLKHGLAEKAAAAQAAKFVARFSLVLAFMPAIVSSFDYAAEVNFPRNVRALTISLNKNAFESKPISPEAVANYLIPAGACPQWEGSKPIQLKNGQGENFDADERGTGIVETKFIGKADLNGDGSEDAVLAIDCTGTPVAHCCAGRASVLTTIVALDVSSGDPTLIGQPLDGEELDSSEGEVSAYISLREDEMPWLDGTNILVYEGPIYDLKNVDEMKRISGWFRYSLEDGMWVRSAV